MVADSIARAHRSQVNLFHYAHSGAKIDNDKEEREAEEQANQDKIVIYNEIIDVMKSLLFIIARKDQQTRKKTPKLFAESKADFLETPKFTLEKVMYE